MAVHQVLNWPLIWISLGLIVGTGAALYAQYPRRADERPRSDSEQQ